MSKAIRVVAPLALGVLIALIFIALCILTGNNLAQIMMELAR